VSVKQLKAKHAFGRSKPTSSAMVKATRFLVLCASFVRDVGVE